MTKLYKPLKQVACYDLVSFFYYFFLLFWRLIMVSFSFSIWLDLATYPNNSVRTSKYNFPHDNIWSFLTPGDISSGAFHPLLLKGFLLSILLTCHPGTSCPYPKDLLFHFCFLDSSFYSLVFSFAVGEQSMYEVHFFEAQPVCLPSYLLHWQSSRIKNSWLKIISFSFPGQLIVY